MSTRRTVLIGALIVIGALVGVGVIVLFSLHAFGCALLLGLPQEC